MTTAMKTGPYKGYSVKTGGNVDPGSRIKKNNDPIKDDTAVPAGNYNVETTKTGIGYLLSPQPAGRGFIEIHMEGITTGCIAMWEDVGQKKWQEFQCDMEATRKAGVDRVPISITYQMSDGSSPPHGNKGDGLPGIPGPLPDTEDPFNQNEE